jgi:hypothetical protein
MGLQRLIELSTISHGSTLESKNTLLFFAFTGTRIPYHASAAVSRKAKRLDTSKRRGKLAGACVMENNVPGASFFGEA